jgi:transcriptional regulator with XRE-family HTH domain
VKKYVPILPSSSGNFNLFIHKIQETVRFIAFFNRKESFMTIGNRLRRLRKQQGLSQADLAAYLHISRMTYTQYETDHREPGLQVLMALAEYYQVSVDYLLGCSTLPGTGTLTDQEILLLSFLPSLSAPRREKVFHTLSQAIGEDLLSQASSSGTRTQ